MRLDLCDNNKVGWPTASIDELCTQVTSGGTPSRQKPEYFVQPPTGIPWVRTQEIRDVILHDTAEHITEKAIRESSAKVLPANTLLVAMYAAPTAGRLALLGREMACNQAACALVVNSEIADSRYLFYQLLHARPELHRLANGAAQQNLSARLIRSLEVVVPPLPEQRAIAEVLGALDDKIEANRRTQEITEGLARARVAKAQEESDSVLPIGSIVERVSDIVQPGDIPDEAAYVGLEHMPQGSILLKEHGRPAGLASAKAKFRSRDVLFGKLRPYFKKVAIAPGVGVCSTDILVLRPKADDWAVAAAVCASDEVIDYASAGSEGTRMPRVSWDYLSRFEVPVPDPDRRQALQAQVSPLLELGISLTVESDRLAAVRDALLPRLLSGELRVRDAESIVGEAV